MQRVFSLTLAVIGVIACGNRAATDKSVQVEADKKPASLPSGPFEVVSVDVEYKVGERTIQGTLTHPKKDGRYPGVLMHAGSGPTDRNWTGPLIKGANGSGKLLAEELTRSGFVVMRFDKLGTGKTTMPTPLTWTTVLDDAAGALQLLRMHGRVDSEKLFLAGHSEGGVHMIGLAQREKKAIAGLVLLASAGRAMGDVILGQLENQFETAGVTGAALEAEMQPIRDSLAKFFRGEDVAPEATSKHVGVQQLFAGIFNPVAAPFARELYAFDPAAGLKDISVPILVWQGDKDIQVTLENDAQRLYDAANKHGRDVTLITSPDADHVMKYETTPKQSLSAANALRYNAADRKLDPDAARAIVDWLRAKSK